MRIGFILHADMLIPNADSLGCDPCGLYCKLRAAGLFSRAAGPKRAENSQKDQFTNEYTVNSRYIEVEGTLLITSI